MPTEPNVVRRLRTLGFVPTGAPGWASTYRSADRAIHVELEVSQHLALAPELRQRVPDGEERGSVYVHRTAASAPLELRGEAVLVANGPYDRFFTSVVTPSGVGEIGNAPGWRDSALEELLRELERMWLERARP